MSICRIVGQLETCPAKYYVMICSAMEPHLLATHEPQLKRFYDAYPYANPHHNLHRFGEVTPGDLLIRGNGKDKHYVALLVARKYPGKSQSVDDSPEERLKWFHAALSKLAAQTRLESVAFPEYLGWLDGEGEWSQYLQHIHDFHAMANLEAGERHHEVNVYVVHDPTRPHPVTQTKRKVKRSMKSMAAQLSEGESTTGRFLSFLNKHPVDLTPPWAPGHGELAASLPKASVTASVTAPVIAPVIAPVTAPRMTGVPPPPPPPPPPPIIGAIAPGAASGGGSRSGASVPSGTLPEVAANLEDPGWQSLIESDSELLKLLTDIQRKLPQLIEPTPDLFPPPELRWSAFNLCEYDALKVVIIGQDPYHQPGQAHGLSFSVRQGVKVPPSLRRIYGALLKDPKIEFRDPGHGELTHWAEQGILMLNASLSVMRSNAGCHLKQWEPFTDRLIQVICERASQPLIFVLWGGKAQRKKSLIQGSSRRIKHHILEYHHPSPMTRKPWDDCPHFSQINELLHARGNTPIDWQLPFAETE